uniref:AlNc14C386G11261 protein n=1 Tax=Albugo laibachii Nc14 TaxID=890382 RepID=F0WYJ8_9STRA|nr:AlNc14C386G11261 [Albugo laibachii Nc14]|eukprot:CCA26556.1 AlNc14C386G11261 [Albugo laibachii Nc14]
MRQTAVPVFQLIHLVTERDRWWIAVCTETPEDSDQLLMSFSGNIKTIREKAVAQLEFTISEGSLQIGNVECVVVPNNFPGGTIELILSRDVMSRIGFCPRHLVAEARRQSLVFDSQSDDIINPEKSPLEVALDANSEAAKEDVPVDLKNEWRDAFLQYRRILDIQNQNDEELQVYRQLKLITEEALAVGCSEDTIKKL